ncbi:unnamed protein product [Fusarium graminearum]|uniref:Chromosome 4, complete genome n=2 Tax=Gibberella zeae TaxID=5518 RepID=A0A0E0SE32_GIBZE|nr:hypothetical protein FG05_30362 [Fusarium graminearum]CAF3443829.1 unnamed protein product [Fusarium graminearum]CAF3616325.1 unnamed protein product [Fusarium graminearum]CAG2014011.1 unnamed protein product [Fusarium graminearum]CEF84695.1 unnamed protein product [Fusarium graminearum]
MSTKTIETPRTLSNVPKKEGVKCPDCDKDFARHSNLSDIKIPSTRDEITTAPTQITGTSSRADQMPKHISKESTNGKDRNV